MTSTKTKANSSSQIPGLKTTKTNRPLKWILIGLALLAILAFVLYLIKKDPAEQKATNDISNDQPAATSNGNGPTETAPPPLAQVSDLHKKIVGNWKVTKRLVGGFPVSGSGKIGTGAWLLYEDGSLKYTTGQYADLGTWKLDKGTLTVSLYALGKHTGYISAIDAKSMTWVTNEIIDGNQVAVTNYLERIK